MKKIAKNILLIISSILIVMLFNYDFKWKVTLFSFILGVGIFFLIKGTNKHNKLNVLTLINALIFSIFLEIGICYQKGKSLSYFWKNINNFFSGILNIVVFTFLLYLLLDFLFNKFQSMKNKEIKSKILKFIFEEHPFLSAFLITLSVSLIYLIFFYPGSMAYDGLWQLDVYYGIDIIAENHPAIVGFSNHHPALVTLIMGWLMDFGRMLGNDNLGMFMFIAPQMLINALIYAYVLKIMKKLDTPLVLRIISLLFYSCFPLLVINSLTYIKDTIFYLMFLFLFVYIYYHFKVNYKKEDKFKYLVLAFVYLVLAFVYLVLYLTRNTGYYIAIITSLVFIFYFIKKYKLVSLCFGLLIVFMLGVNFTYHKVFLVKMHIKEASVREMLSVPLQQTARYLKYYPHDLSKKEREILENLFIDDLENVVKVYRPNRSDNVKWKFKEYPSDKELKDYIKVWFTMFIKHPFVYFDATLNNIYGYFYPNVMNFIGEDIGFYYIDVDGPVNTKELDLHWNNLKWGRDALENIATKMSKTKGIRQLYTPAFYVWLLISSCIYLIENKKKEILCYFTPLFMVVVTCLISPVNAHMRYLQPVMVSIPFVLAIIYNETKKLPK